MGRDVSCLYEKFYKLAYLIALKWVEKGLIERSEALSLAHLGLAKAINSKTFNPKKSKFTTYMTVTIDNEIRMFLRDERKRKEDLSLDFPMVNRFGDIQELRELIPDPKSQTDFQRREDLIVVKELLDQVWPQLKPLEQRAFILWLQGKKQTQIAQETGFSQSYMSRVVRKVVEKLRKEWEKSAG